MFFPFLLQSVLSHTPEIRFRSAARADHVIVARA